MQTPKRADYSVASGDGQIKEGEKGQTAPTTTQEKRRKIKPAGKSFRTY